MAEKEQTKVKGIKIVDGYAELKPSLPGKRPTQVCVGPKTYRGDYLKLVGHDDRKKPITETVKSKVRFVPVDIAKTLPEKLFIQA
ncbi:MAG: hypothetical protein DRP56_06880 [Planctomycetota bacterium]|nr:MAG: hypothetical protein DRP45_11600 [candidate division Zixibacteria bacterium]RKY06724.1 MAG: hypothetical protein DRP56_06880 [Planctomycetota bacterium]